MAEETNPVGGCLGCGCLLAFGFGLFVFGSLVFGGIIDDFMELFGIFGELTGVGIIAFLLFMGVLFVAWVLDQPSK